MDRLYWSQLTLSSRTYTKRHNLECLSIQTIFLRTLLTHILPTDSHLFPASHPFMLQKREPPDMTHQKIMQTRNTKICDRHPMKRLKIWASGPPPGVIFPRRRGFPTCLMGNYIHTSHLSLVDYTSNACGTIAYWTHLLESLSLVPRESGPQEGILFALSKEWKGTKIVSCNI